MSIGDTIKTLRRAKNLTQEDLAEYLGISSKAISQWETDRTSPDLSQIPLLCNFFNVTSDSLLGIDISAKQKKIDGIYNAAYEIACTGDHKKSIAMWLDGIKQFPDSFKLIIQYVDEVYMYSHMLDDEEAHIESALSFIDKIMSDCTDSKIRNEAISTACMWYPKLGKAERAIELAGTLPDVTYSDMMLYISTGAKKHEQWCENIMCNFTKSIGDLSAYAYSKDDNGVDIFADDEKIDLFKKQIEMFRLFFEKGDYMFHAQYIEVPYRHLARIYSGKNDAENALSSLAEAAEYAMLFDTYDYAEKQKSLIARGNVPGGVWRHDTHNHSYDILEWMQTDEIFDSIRNAERFAEITETLGKTAV